jgi:hypothetical protein
VILNLFLMLKVWPMIHLAYILSLLSCFHCVCFPSFFVCVALVCLAFSSCLISAVFNIFFRQFAFLLFFRVSIKNRISSHREQSDLKFRKPKPISWVFIFQLPQQQFRFKFLLSQYISTVLPPQFMHLSYHGRVFSSSCP